MHSGKRGEINAAGYEKRRPRNDNKRRLSGPPSFFEVAPELSAYDALYKMAATLVRKSNAFAAVMYNEDFTKVKQIVPLTVSSFRIYEDDDGNILFRFTWDYDGKTYVLPYQSVIHIRARFSKNVL